MSTQTWRTPARSCMPTLGWLDGAAPLTRCRPHPFLVAPHLHAVCAIGYGIPQGAGSSSPCSRCPVGTWFRSLWASPARFVCWPCPSATTTAAVGAQSSTQCSECRVGRGCDAPMHVALTAWCRPLRSIARRRAGNAHCTYTIVRCKVLDGCSTITHVAGACARPGS